MKAISVLIKPASGNCNLRCKYCFYNSIIRNRETENYGMMDLDTLEILVKKVFESADIACTFAFQGGEPTLVGLDFYKTLIELQKKYNTKNIQVNNALQTNGIVIDDNWAKFLNKNNFLVGLSLDGPKDIHDTNRTDVNKKGSYNTVMNAVRLFNKYGVEYNILFVVNAYVARHITKIYNFFKKQKFNYLQFIPCLDPLEEKPGGHEYSLTPEKYATFLKTLFDLWHEDVVKGKMISIRTFDNYIGMLLGYRPEACGMMGECNCQFVIEADGGVYPCDFYVYDDWYMGNIKEQSFEELYNSNTAKNFIDVSKHVSPECKQCKWANICRGGCRRTREPFENGKPVLNYYCPSYMEFFEYAMPRMQQLARMFGRKITG